MKWHNRYIDLAKETAKWSKDPSKRIGAVIVGDKGQILSMGYNGFPRGIVDSEERLNNRETKYKYVVHAELNAIICAARNGIALEGASIYVTGLPICRECAKAIIQVGISTVYMDTKPVDNWKQSGEEGLELFEEAGIKCVYVHSQNKDNNE